MTFLYFIEDSLGYVKIGITKCLSTRLSSIQSSNALLLNLIGYLSFEKGQEPSAADIERDLHIKFAKHRIRGEWFYKSTEILKFISDHCKKDINYIQFSPEDFKRLGGSV